MTILRTWSWLAFGRTGLAAAVRGAEFGSRIVMLEKNSNFGRSTGIAVGSMTVCCTSMQKAEDIEDSPNDHNADIGKDYGIRCVSHGRIP